MKKFVLLIVCLSVSAGSLMAGTDSILFSQTYSFVSVDKSLQSQGLCDDFIPAFDGYIGEVDLWMQFLGGVPSSLTMTIGEDLGAIDPNTAPTLFTGVVPVSYDLTGDVYQGNSVYRVTCSLPSAVPVETGKRYWLKVTMPVLGFWLGQQPLVFGSSMWARTGSTWQTSQNAFGYDVDSFFNIYTPVSLERNSWASIKSSF